MRSLTETLTNVGFIWRLQIDAAARQMEAFARYVGEKGAGWTGHVSSHEKIDIDGHRAYPIGKNVKNMLYSLLRPIHLPRPGGRRCSPCFLISLGLKSQQVATITRPASWAATRQGDVQAAARVA